ncbi:MAG TPA: hypothetical protein VFM17_02015 [Candidatus Eisenbacteria bacterium]|nr:hypothetical protein [Candidatus Eisenbacteria bacterium]
MTRFLARAAAAAFLAGLLHAIPAPAAGPTFESVWQDGQAELCGYRYVVTRYGQSRGGQAVAVYVTEPFSERRRVKLDDPAASPGDAFEALKLNLVRDFQTGIYDYNTMTSLFVRSSDIIPAKISFSSAEWCGHVYEELRFDRDAVRQSIRSYFEGESADRSLDAPRGGVPEENLHVLLRGLRGDFLPPGRKRSVPFLPSAFARRLVHSKAVWGSAEIERAARPETVRVPAGSFEADRYTVRASDGREGRYWIESAPPRRVLRWTWTGAARDGRMGGDAAESAELTGSERLPYWRLHGNGDEEILRRLGLDPLPAAGPPRE